MKTCMNYPTKFYNGQKVKIISGFHLGKIGKIYNSHGLNRKPLGLLDDSFERMFSEPSYEINVGWLTESIYCYESQLETA